MIHTKRNEEISFSYLNAICAMKGIAFERQIHDDDSIDAFLKKQVLTKDGRNYNAQLGIQLKATAQELSQDDDVINFVLKVKNYNDLRGESTVQQLLFVLVLPSVETEWVTWTIDELIIKQCMYWVNLKNHGETENASSVTIKLPKSNTVSPENLLALMQKIAEEEEL